MGLLRIKSMQGRRRIASALDAALGVEWDSENIISGGQPNMAEPVFNALADRMVFADDFSRYSNVIPDMMTAQTALAKPITSFAFGGESKTTLGAAGSGHNGVGKELRTDDNIIADGTTQGGVSIATPSGGSWTPGLWSDVNVMQFWFRFNQVPNGGLSTKFFEWWPTNARQRTQYSISGESVNGHYTMGCSPSSRAMAHYSVNYPTLSYNQNGVKEWFDWGNAWPSPPEYGYQARGPYLLDLAQTNAWHRCTIVHRSQSVDNWVDYSWWLNYWPNQGVPFQDVHPSSRDGIMRVWLDGTKVEDWSAASMGRLIPEGTRPWCTRWQLDTLCGNRSPEGNYIVNNFLFPGTLVVGSNGLHMGWSDLKWWIQGG